MTRVNLAQPHEVTSRICVRAWWTAPSKHRCPCTVNGRGCVAFVAPLSFSTAGPPLGQPLPAPLLLAHASSHTAIPETQPAKPLSVFYVHMRTEAPFPKPARRHALLACTAAHRPPGPAIDHGSPSLPHRGSCASTSFFRRPRRRPARRSSTSSRTWSRRTSPAAGCRRLFYVHIRLASGVKPLLTV